MLKNLKTFTFISIFFFLSSFSINATQIEEELLYNKYTLPDKYIVKIGDKFQQKREFNWENIQNLLNEIDKFQNQSEKTGTLKNYKNINSKPDIAKNMSSSTSDSYGVRRNQGIPLYTENNLKQPERYAWDGSLVSILSKNNNFTKVKLKDIDGIWFIPNKYVQEISTKYFNKIVIVNRSYQNVVTLERVNGIWKIRSKNPITTGVNKAPNSYDTPLGTFVTQSKSLRMNYMNFRDETKPGGYAPYATRFSGGGYFHGFPVDLPKTEIIEYSHSLGSLPMSHMCIRSSASHGEFVYNWADINKSLFLIVD